jgi:mRNA deadenylase 3'-5' endonuclease subunit Ccr4
MEKNLFKRTEQPLTEGSTLRIMTSNILADRWVSGRNYGSVAKRAEMYAGVLMVYRPSLVGVQETDDPWTKNLPYYLDYLREYL